MRLRLRVMRSRLLLAEVTATFVAVKVEPPSKFDTTSRSAKLSQSRRLCKKMIAKDQACVEAKD